MRVTQALCLLAVAVSGILGSAPASLAAPTQQITFAPPTLEAKSGTSARITVTVTNSDTTDHTLFAIVALIPPTGVTLAPTDITIPWDHTSGPLPVPLVPDPTGTLPNAEVGILSTDGVNPATFTLAPQQAVSIPLTVTITRTVPAGQFYLGLA